MLGVRAIALAISMLAASFVTAPGALAGNTTDDGAVATWDDTSLKVPTLACFDVPVTITVPSNAGGPLYYWTYLLITTPNAPEQEVAFAVQGFYLGGDPKYPRPATGPTVTRKVNVCTEKLTSGFGPYKLYFASTSGDLKFFGESIYLSPTEQRALAVQSGTLTQLTFNDGSAPAPAPVAKKITCKKKSSGVIKKFARTKCPAGWVRVTRS